MTIFRNDTFDGWKRYNSGETYKDLQFIGCTFQSCSASLTAEELSKRVRLIDAEFRACRIAACSVTAAIVEDVLVDGMKISGLFQTWAAVFKHVTLKGKIDRVMLSPFFSPEESPYFAPGKPPSKFRQMLEKANADYYAAVDWALDISQAEFKDFDCRGVPSRLVRRDPETQIMVRRERVMAAGDAAAAGGAYWHSWLKLFLQDNWYADAVLVAPKRSPRFKELLPGLKELRRVGIAEPD